MDLSWLSWTFRCGDPVNSSAPGRRGCLIFGLPTLSGTGPFSNLPSAKPPILWKLRGSTLRPNRNASNRASRKPGSGATDWSRRDNRLLVRSGEIGGLYVRRRRLYLDVDADDFLPAILLDHAGALAELRETKVRILAEF